MPTGPRPVPRDESGSYKGISAVDDPVRLSVPEYDPETEQKGPAHRVAIYHEETNLRVVLDDAEAGSPFQGDEPNLFIERQPDKWLIVFHPHSGDPTCGIELYSDRVEVQDAGGQVYIKEDLP